MFVALSANLLRSRVLLRAAAEGATPDVVPQLFDQLRVLLLDLLRKLLPAGKHSEDTPLTTGLEFFEAGSAAGDFPLEATRDKERQPVDCGRRSRLLLD